MSKDALLGSAVVLAAGQIRAYFTPADEDAPELVALNNLLSCVSRFGPGEFVVPQDFFDLCAQDLFERYGEEAWTMRRTDGSYRRILQDCTIWVAESGELDGRIFFRPVGDKQKRVLVFAITENHQLRGADEVYGERLDGPPAMGNSRDGAS